MPLSTSLSRDTVAETNRRLWDEAKEKYGNIGFGSQFPDEERSRISSYLHGMEVLLIWDQKGPALSHLRSYSIPTDVCEQLITDFCIDEQIDADQIVLERPATRADKYAEFEEWAGLHDGEQFSTEELMSQSGFSRPTILKYLKESLYFKKVKKGLWEATRPPERD